MYWIAISMTISANVIYHLCAKATGSAHPLASLTVTYAVSLFCCIILYPLTTQNLNVLEELKNVNIYSAILGISIVLLEAGFILAYRYGWNISNAALFANVCVALILIPIAIFYFKDTLGPKQILGIVLSISGLVLLAK